MPDDVAVQIEVLQYDRIVALVVTVVVALRTETWRARNATVCIVPEISVRAVVLVAIVGLVLAGVLCDMVRERSDALFACTVFAVLADFLIVIGIV